jgi:hypothetical protein
LKKLFLTRSTFHSEDVVEHDHVLLRHSAPPVSLINIEMTKTASSRALLSLNFLLTKLGQFLNIDRPASGG